MKISVDKNDLFNLINGLAVPEGPFIHQERIKTIDSKLYQFCGTGHNPDWEWNKDELLKLTEDELYCFYQMLIKKDNTNEITVFNF